MRHRGLRLSWLLAALVALPALTACAMDASPGAGERTTLPRRAWLPEGEPRAVILALHGFNDYSQAFAGFGTHAAARGVAVHAFDQRGFGASPDAGYWAGTRTLMAEVRRELARLAHLHPGAPLYLLGESMGGAVVIAATAQGEPLPVYGIILSAPAIWGGEELNPLYRATLWLAVRLVPDLKLSGRGLDVQASDNLDMLRSLGADPLVIKETRVAAIAGLVALMDQAFAHADKLPGPLLVLGGARDEIVPPEAHAAMRERLKAIPCTAITYPDGWHLLLRDLQRHVVWDDVLAWIAGEPLPSGQDAPCNAALSPVAAAQP